MVKNTGGNKAKGFARKNEKVGISNRIRMSECEDEKYAIVRKIYGGSMCEIFCDDNICRQGIIRGKFRGRGKRTSMITSGTLVLIGLRGWASESKSDKLEQADILEVYSSLELDQLKQKPQFPIEFLESSMKEMFGNTASDNKNDIYEFSTIEQTLNEINNDDKQVITVDSGEKIDINDI